MDQTQRHTLWWFMGDSLDFVVAACKKLSNTFFFMFVMIGNNFITDIHTCLVLGETVVAGSWHYLLLCSAIISLFSTICTNASYYYT